MIPPIRFPCRRCYMSYLEALNLAGLFGGPVAAVAITLAYEHFRRTRDQRMQVFKMLINTRHLPGDPSWSIAVNMVQLEFNRHEKIMAAWRAYMALVRFEPTAENKEVQQTQIAAKQATLIFEIAKSLGFKISETDIQTEAYVAKGYIARDNLYLESLLAMVSIANTMKQQHQLIANQVASAAQSKKLEAAE